MPRAEWKIVSRTQIFVPSAFDDQVCIAEALSDLDSEIEILEFKLQKYRQIKIGMMQTLLTGKIRLV
jgi:type I restriction enzyme S subunit